MDMHPEQLTVIVETVRALVDRLEQEDVALGAEVRFVTWNDTVRPTCSVVPSPGALRAACPSAPSMVTVSTAVMSRRMVASIRRRTVASWQCGVGSDRSDLEVA